MNLFFPYVQEYNHPTDADYTDIPGLLRRWDAGKLQNPHPEKTGTCILIKAI